MNDETHDSTSTLLSGEAKQEGGGGGGGGGGSLDTVPPFGVKPAWERPTLRMIDIEGTESSPLDSPFNNEAIGYQIQS